MGLNLHVKGYNSDYKRNSKIGSYGGFDEFRKEWAKHLGFDLDEMIGFGGTKEWTNEPLQSFFNHSDCDGDLTPSECREILTQAQKDLPELKDKTQSSYSLPILIEFCEQAVKTNSKLEFV